MASKIVILKEEGKIIETIDNPLFQCEDYKQQKEYGKLYYQVEKAIKGEYYEE
ncbi:MAG: hypothetical protein RR425_04025 [Erysipelotrichales bacterium]